MTNQERSILKFYIICATVINIILLTISLANAQNTYTDDEMCIAIWWTEGCGTRECEYLYGIRSVNYDSQEEALEICLRSVRNNRKRYSDYGHKRFDSFERYFANRWSPLNADNDKRGLNKNFYKNLMWFLDNPKE